jgi:homoserine O-acetyltransferase
MVLDDVTDAERKALARCRHAILGVERPLRLDCGVDLGPYRVAYQTYGTLNAEKSNAVLICHALTMDQFVADQHPVTGNKGWGESIVGPGKVLDPAHYFIICANVLGGCMGTTGPLACDPATGQPWNLRFPVVTVADMVRAQVALLDHLGIPDLFCVIGGSMGGMQVLEWAITYPRRVRSIAPIAACMQATAQQIAWGAIGRRAIRLDPRWRGGDYYDARPGDGPAEGLAIARQIAQVTFRSDNVFTDRFGRDLADRPAFGDTFGLWQQFEVERYLEYHGERLVHRFDANSYLVIGKAMDLHDIARSRGSVESAMARITVPSLAIGISSDMLYPAYQQRSVHEMLTRQGTPSSYAEVDSPHGHDAFLINVDQVSEPLGKFLGRVG